MKAVVIHKEDDRTRTTEIENVTGAHVLCNLNKVAINGTVFHDVEEVRYHEEEEPHRLAGAEPRTQPEGAGE